MRLSLPRMLAAIFMAMTVLVAGAKAHHGWSWAEEDQIELNGTIQDIYIGPPHPVLKVETADAVVWTVELGNPRQTARAGFDESSAAVGDEIVALGNRSTDPSETRIKAVRITVRGVTYDIYPDRIQGG